MRTSRCVVVGLIAVAGLAAISCKDSSGGGSAGSAGSASDPWKANESRGARSATVVTTTGSATTVTAGVHGSGISKTERRTLAAFSSIEVSGTFACDVSIGDAPSVEIVGDDNIVSLIKTEVSGDKLRVFVDGSISTKLELRLKITTKALVAYSVSGSSVTTIHGITGDAFALEVSGAGNVTLLGAVAHLTATVSGTAEVTADGLRADHAKLDIAGAASMDIAAKDTLDVEISGTGHVRYVGTPTVTKQVAGVGTVEPR